MKHRATDLGAADGPSHQSCIFCMASSLVAAIQVFTSTASILPKSDRPPPSALQITITKCPRLYLLIMQLAPFLLPASFYCVAFEAFGTFVSSLMTPVLVARASSWLTRDTLNMPERMLKIACVFWVMFKIKWIVNKFKPWIEFGKSFIPWMHGTGYDYQWQRGMLEVLFIPYL